ncbi:MAG: tRNA guanosine(34) transglycosylase Tgt [Cyanobacteriota/Melainabacteria group bacterium]
MNTVSSIKYELVAECPWSGARAAVLTTPHGCIETPVFMPVGTNAALRAMTFDDVERCGAEIVLSNAYHLYLRPGHELVKKAGGLHGFMNWQKPILTDSGGFQVFSLDSLRRITDDGVHFQDHKGGARHFIGPEKSMEIQNALGADIIMAFDDCVKNPATIDEARAAMDRTHRWLERCVESHSRAGDQALFGIVQGSIYEDLRAESVKQVTSFDLPGFAIGGVAVGEDRDTIERIVLFATPLLPREKPRYLMGVGTPWDIVFSVRAGIDMFDCVSPTRLARHGAAFTSFGRIAIKNADYREDFSPLDPDCDCFTCAKYSRAYLCHLIRAKEMSGATLISIHNVRFLIRQAQLCREAIIEGRFKEYFLEFAANMGKELGT